MTKVKIINKSPHQLPSRATDLSAGYDLRAHLKNSISIRPFERVIVGTSLFMELPEGYEGQIRPRSGLAKNKGITVLNAPGTIDADYRGEVKVLLVNLSHETHNINDGERIAQLIIARHESISWEEVENLSASERGEKGYGSSGTH